MVSSDVVLQEERLLCKADPLLLDSVGRVNNSVKTNKLRPKISSLGVLFSSQKSTIPVDQVYWFALRATYSRELKVQTLLQAKGIRSFVPMRWKQEEKNGKIQKKLVSAVSNLCFAYTTKAVLDGFLQSFGEKPVASYYWDRAAGHPLIVPEAAMEDFIRVASSLDEDLLYLKDISDKLRQGQPVLVTNGPFKGVHGKVVRIQKNRRVMVELPGFLAVTTCFIAPQDLRLEGERV